MLNRAVLLVLAGLAGCAPVPSAAERPGALPRIPAERPEEGKIGEPAAPENGVEAPEKLIEAERHYRLALAWFNRADFDKAKVEAQLAVQAWPDHLSARKLLSDVNEIIVGGPTGLRGIGDTELQIARVTAEQARAEISRHLLQGRRYLEAKMPAAAVREFESAEFKIRNLPYEMSALNELLPRVRELLARAKAER